METQTLEAPEGMQADTAQSEDAFSLESATPEQFVDRLKTDNQLRDEYMNNPYDEKFNRINGLLNTPPSQREQAPATDTQAQPDQQKPEETQEDSKETDQLADVILENVKIPKDLLGTYLSNGRSVSEAVIEALKGKVEADKTIESFRNRNNSQMDDNLALRKELIQAQRKIAEAQQAADSAKNIVPKQPVLDIDFDALDSFESYDDSTHDSVLKVRDQLKKIKEQYGPKSGQEQQQVPQATEVPDTTGQQSAELTPEAKQSREQIEKQVIELEFADIDALQQEVPELKTNMPFAVLNQAVDSFQRGIMRASGYGDDLAKATNLYFSDTPAGENFRETCKNQGIVSPEGYDKHQFILTNIRSRRLENIDNYRKVIESKTGKKLEPWEVLDAPNISYKDLYRSGKKYEPPAPQQTPQQTQPDKLQQTISQHKASGTRVQDTVPEIPPSMGSPSVGDIGQTGQDEFNRLVTQFVTNPSAMKREDAAKLQKIYEYAGVDCPSGLTDILKE